MCARRLAKPKATGFNQFLDTLGAQCQPLWIGGQQQPQINSQYARARQSNFDMFLDNTSRLYYNWMSPADYRVAGAVDRVDYD